jgi:protein phosphatase
MSFETVARTDVGEAREHNEDSVLVTEIDGTTLLAVADGMGGHRAGDVASETALAEFSDVLGTELDAGTAPQEALERGITEANERLHTLAAENPEYEGMGTTLVAASVDKEQARLVNVGDSRAYEVTDDAIEQITVDQSLVQELVESGELTPEEAEDHPQRNVISQALGTDETVEPDLYRRTLSGAILLCSDGLTEEVPESEIHEILMDSSSLSTASDRLVDRANEYGGNDNISVVIGQIL